MNTPQTIAEVDAALENIEVERKRLKKIRQDLIRQKASNTFKENYQEAKYKFTAEVAGDGIWTHNKAQLKVYFDFEDVKGYEQFNVCFDPEIWDTEELGIIYTDKKFLSCVKEQLSKMIENPKFSYSESGMQGNDHVNFDVSGPTRKKILKFLAG